MGWRLWELPTALCSSILFTHHQCITTLLSVPRIRVSRALVCPAGKAGVTREDARTSLVHWALAEDFLITSGSGRVPKTQPHL